MHLYFKKDTIFASDLYGRLAFKIPYRSAAHIIISNIEIQILGGVVVSGDKTLGTTYEVDKFSLLFSLALAGADLGLLKAGGRAF